MKSARLYANHTMTGTLLAALVPVDVESSVYLQAVELLDAHSETYPVKAEIWVCVVTSTKAVIQTIHRAFGLAS